jgi:hypothetical protein
MFALRLLIAICLTLLVPATCLCTAVEAKLAAPGSVRIYDLKQQPELTAATTAQFANEQANTTLADGQYLIEAQQLAKGKFFIYTRYVQIRLSDDAEILLKSTDEACLVAVIKGHAVLKNLQDCNVIRVQAGAVYEALALNQKSSQSEQRTTMYVQTSKLPIFQTSRFATSLFSINEESAELARIGKHVHPVARNKPAARLAEIISPPTNCNYKLNSEVRIPAILVQHFPPNGFIPTEAPNGLMADRERDSVK